jgi:hypothetical protein
MFAWLLELLSPARQHLKAEDKGMGDASFEPTRSKAHLVDTQNNPSEFQKKSVLDDELLNKDFKPIKDCIDEIRRLKPGSEPSSSDVIIAKWK